MKELFLSLQPYYNRPFDKLRDLRSLSLSKRRPN